MEEIAKVNLLWGYPVERVLPLIERALYIVESNPNTGIEERIRINLKLADLYNMTRNTKEATTAYQKTWHLMQGADEGMGKVLETPVPLTFIIDPRRYVQYVKKKSSGPNEELFIEAQYSVGKDGRARKVKIIDDNMGVSARRYLLQDLKVAKFRPGVVDGEVIETPNLILRPMFRVEETADSNQTNPLFESRRVRVLGSNGLTPLFINPDPVFSKPNPAVLDALRYNQSRQ